MTKKKKKNIRPWMGQGKQFSLKKKSRKLLRRMGARIRDLGETLTGKKK